MEIDELFRLNSKSQEANKLIFRVAESTNGRCILCAGFEDKALCNKLPDCYNPQSEPSLMFIKLTSTEAKRAIKQKLTINQY